MTAGPPESLRVLAVAETWAGSNGYAFVRALRRAGHSVRVVPAEEFVPGRWKSLPLRLARRALEPLCVAEFNRNLVSRAGHLRPHLFFVFKGRYVTADTVRALRGTGATAVNFYPDVSFMAHGPHIPRALPEYDWVFTTKSFGLEDMRRNLGVTRASFMPHASDPEVHRPVPLAPDERERYSCDASFIGTWSPKKQAHLEVLTARRPDLRLRIWGAQWERAGRKLAPFVEGYPVHGLEYAKAVGASSVNLCILSEAREGASSGDRITSRTFHIPAAGGFLLHERTEELLGILREGEECGAFGSPEEMADAVAEWCGNDSGRRSVAEAGRRRILEAGHTVDHRVAAILEKVRAMRAASPGGGP